MTKLLTTTKYVKYINKNIFNYHNYAESNNSRNTFRDLITKYTNFISQPLQLGNLVPCDDEGNYLEEPNSNDKKYNQYNIVKTIFNKEQYDEDYLKYKQAKDKVLFKGWELKEGKYLFPPNTVCSAISIINNKFICVTTIEDLILFKNGGWNYDLIPTKNCLKQLGL